MPFPSEVFLFLYLPLVTILYYVIFLKRPIGKNIFLLIASLLFYAYSNPIYVALLLIIAFLHYIFGVLMHRFQNNLFIKRLTLVVMIISDALILGYFKYANFLITNLNTFFNCDFELLEIVLPIGISFYIFQAISYVADVYRDDRNFEMNFLNLSLYISFFPKLIEGPIVRYNEMAKEIKDRKESFKSFSIGVNRFIIGLGKKVLLANQFGVVADAVFEGINGSTNTNSVLLLWLGAISYTLQIYFDFSGYSDMAIGLARMFGFRFKENFKYPYISESLTEFWRRCISLFKRGLETTSTSHWGVQS